MNGSLILNITACQNYHLYANYRIDGMRFGDISSIYGMQYGVYYTGDATAITIPKYAPISTSNKTQYYEIEVIISIEDAPNLEAVYMSDAVTRVEYYGFSNCDKLTEVAFSPNLETICSYAFIDCPSLKTVSLPESLMEIYPTSFYCDHMQFAVYDNMMYVGNEQNPYMVLLQVCDTSLVTGEIHPDTKIIANNAFDECRQLTEIVIPAGVSVIGSGAFAECYAMTSIVFEEPEGWQLFSRSSGYAPVEFSLADATKAAKALVYRSSGGFIYNYSGRYLIRT